MDTSSRNDNGLERMLGDIQRELDFASAYLGKRQFMPRVVDAIRAVPRDRFVPAHARSQSYANHPLSIGHGQTISQPFIVALMTDLLNPVSSQRILEVGTGSGYQTAVLAHLVAHVYSAEVIDDLAQEARRRLADLGLNNVTIQCRDGNGGWPEHAPYDGIIVTAAAPHVPSALLDQLAPGGRMVIPVGVSPGVQSLVLIEKDDQGAVTQRDVIPVAFVPMTGHAHSRL